jgi:hypothetical protein
MLALIEALEVKVALADAKAALAVERFSSYSAAC